ncbi:hypothetical protein B0T22DRAFT_19581 [Podospora appendiculata]|uniref:Uncharacterized protein n=1 Tax=Podospora appendiculata TaxID=314037 RepID=A0AAE1CFQ0_9PEZI|nr:hypothetical protein B0T22DRAFT_19581 [Podospora appendiculata]
MTDSSSLHGARSPLTGRSMSSVTTDAAASPATPGTPGNHALRRSATVATDGAQIRRRSMPGFPSSELPSEEGRRRNSTFSETSFTGVKRNVQEDLFSPCGDGLERPWWSSFSLVFALLPAIGGILHKNGSAVLTDIALLGLAAIFLNWSVTQPWAWYNSVQEIRIREEAMVEIVLEDDSEGEDRPSPSTPSKTTALLNDLPEEQDNASAPSPGISPNAGGRDRATHASKALRELYINEIGALLACFAAPVAGAYLLHTIRDQLSRPSEGLVSNLNLTVFVLAAEIGPLSHLMKLVKARTLHLHKVVLANPYREEMATAAQVQDMMQRLDELEVKAVATETKAGQQNGSTPNSGPGREKQEARMIREVRNAIQPELDALNRAVRRYEKKASVLAQVTDSRLSAIDTRLNDAIALAAAAARGSSSDWSFFLLLWENIVWIISLPHKTVFGTVRLALRPVVGLFRRSGKTTQEKGGYRDLRRAPGRSGSSSRMNSSDRVSTRISKR